MCDKRYKLLCVLPYLFYFCYQLLAFASVMLQFSWTISGSVIGPLAELSYEPFLIVQLFPHFVVIVGTWKDITLVVKHKRLHVLGFADCGILGACKMFLSFLQWHFEIEDLAALDLRASDRKQSYLSRNEKQWTTFARAFVLSRSVQAFVPPMSFLWCLKSCTWERLEK